MEKPNTCVAIVSTLDGGCQYVGVVKTITKTEYATLLGEQREHERKLKERINTLDARCDLMSETIIELKKEIAILKGEDENEESIENI